MCYPERQEAKSEVSHSFFESESAALAAETIISNLMTGNTETHQITSYEGALRRTIPNASAMSYFLDT